jgi:hypothetical protein
MKIDGKQILQETYDVFIKSGFKEVMDKSDTVPESEYRQLHSKCLVPTAITIDTELMIKELEPYKFVQWGKNHQHLPRYGLALVNQSGQLIDDDPINGSLMEYNKLNPNNPLIETNCTKPTEVMNIKSLKPLSVFNDYWTRSNIFKWGDTAHFLPHIDTVVPSMWLRLWMGTEGVVVRFYNEETEELETVEYEPGRLYLIDTSIIHDAYSVKENYQLFLSVLPGASSLINSLLI